MALFCFGLSLMSTSIRAHTIKLKLSARGGDAATRALYSGSSTLTFTPPFDRLALHALMKRFFPHQEGTLGDLLKIGKITGGAKAYLFWPGPTALGIQVKSKSQNSKVLLTSDGRHGVAKNLLEIVTFGQRGIGTRLLGQQVKAFTSLPGLPFSSILTSPALFATVPIWKKMGFSQRPYTSWSDADAFEFDLRPDSLSRKVLQRYLVTKSVDLADVSIEPANPAAKELFFTVGDEK